MFNCRAQAATFPGTNWEARTPAQVGLDVAKLDSIRSYLGGRGCIVRHGYLVYTWGDIATRGDVASAAKPWYSTFLFKAVEEGRLASLDTPAAGFEPRLSALNSALGHKDTNITFRHFASQTSCYGVQEMPGMAYDYNDWQMALFWDTLFLKVFGAAYTNVDATVLRPKLTSILQCQDQPTFMAFGDGDRPGRLAVSPRDFARFGLLYLHQGNWNGTQVISAAHAKLAVTRPLPLALPRTTGVAAEMIAGQRSLGSTTLPDNQTDHDGSYSWLWWLNGIRRNGQRRWPGAPSDVYACLGHANGKRGMAVLPSQEVVLAWNDTRLDTYPAVPHPLNLVFKHLLDAITNAAPPPSSGASHR
jgi:CubicO group peptidase (beta-lactamase class C family)